MYYNYVYNTTNLSRVGGSMPELPVYIENPVPLSFRGSGPDRTVTRDASQVNGCSIDHLVTLCTFILDIWLLSQDLPRGN